MHKNLLTKCLQGRKATLKYLKQHQIPLTQIPEDMKIQTAGHVLCPEVKISTSQFILLNILPGLALELFVMSQVMLLGT